MNVVAILVCVAVLWLPIFCKDAKFHSDEAKILTKILDHPDLFLSETSPIGKNGSGPVIAETNMYIRHISEVNEENMEYRAQLTFRQEWDDTRLSYSRDFPHFKRYIQYLNTGSIWKPDVFFSNEKEGHIFDILQRNSLLRIYPDGHILYSIRISLKLSCPMNFKNFPMDEQKCSIVLASYGYTTEDLVFLWKSDNPVQITKNLHLNHFTLNKYETDYCTSKTTTGEYTCLKLNISFSRNFGYYATRVYIPFTMLLIISWIPFWLNSRDTITRISIWVGDLIATTLFASSINSMIPKVSYTMAIDVWTGVCWTFLLAAVIECVVVARIVFQSRESPDGDHKEKIRRGSSCGKLCKKYCPQTIDMISRIIYPVCFIVFNIIYWTKYA